MSSILDRIVADKRLEVALRKQLIPVKQLEQSVLFERHCPSLSTRLTESTSAHIRISFKGIINSVTDIDTLNRAISF